MLHLENTCWCPSAGNIWGGRGKDWEGERGGVERDGEGVDVRLLEWEGGLEEGGSNVLPTLPLVFTEVLFLFPIAVASLSLPPASAAFSSFLKLSSLMVRWLFTSTLPSFTFSLLRVCSSSPPITPRPSSVPATAPPMTISRRRSPPTNKGVRLPPDPPPSPSILFGLRLLLLSS